MNQYFLHRRKLTSYRKDAALLMMNAESGHSTIRLYLFQIHVLPNSISKEVPCAKTNQA
jgi:hypothetical protein